jgi:hypothetical protein
MANETTYVGSPNWYLALAMNTVLYETFADMTDLSSTLTDYGSVNGTNSATSKIPTVTFDDPMAAANGDEVTPIGNTAVTNGAATLAVARQALARGVSDLSELVGEGGPRPGLARFGVEMANAAVLRITDMIAALFGGLSNIAGISGEAMTVDDLYEAFYILIRNGASGQLYFVGSPQQIVDFLNSLRNEGLKLIPADGSSSLDTLGNQQNWGLMGQFSGAQIWKSDSVTTNGPDSEGAVYTQNAFGKMHGVPNVQHAAAGSFMSATADGSPIFVEFDREPKAGLTDVVGNLYYGVGEIDDDEGVRVRTSAT